MEIRSIHLGGMFHAEEEIQMTSTMANFVGQLQGFVYNGNRYCEAFVCFIAHSFQNSEFFKPQNFSSGFKMNITNKAYKVN